MAQTVSTEPEGAEVAIAPYRARRPDWLTLGRTPLEVRLPRGQFRMRLAKAGFGTLEVASVPPRQHYRLDPRGHDPTRHGPGRGGALPAHLGIAGALDDFWIDRFEVTNRAVPGVRRPGRLSPARVLARGVRRRRTRRAMVRGHGAVPRHDRQARAGDVGRRHAIPKGAATFRSAA